MAQARLQPGFFQGGEEFGAGAEHADFFRIDQVEQAFGAGVERRAVVQYRGGADRQHRHQPVPHHPAAGGVVEQAVLAVQVGMQAVFLQVRQQYAARAMDDALGDAGGAAGIEDIQRVIERHRDKFGFAAGFVEVVPQRDVGVGWCSPQP